LRDRRYCSRAGRGHGRPEWTPNHTERESAAALWRGAV